MAKRHYSEIRTLPARGVQIYGILIGAAHNRQILTYGMVAEMLGYNGAGVLDRQLGLVMNWCNDNDLPPLTALVVNADTGVPGAGLNWIQDIHADRERVFGYDWYDLVPPTVEEFEAYGNVR